MRRTRTSISSSAIVIALCLLAAACASSSGSDATNEPPAGDVDVGVDVDQNDSSDAADSADAPEPETSGDADADAADTAEAGGDEATYLTGDSDYIFDQTELRTYEITVSETDLATIDADPAAEEWVEASLQFEGQDIGSVGLRYKGSVGAFVGCLDGTDVFNPSGSKVCTKLSMKVKLNWDDSGDTFYNLKKLQFHAANLDDSLMRDRLGYWLFAEMGVPTPRAVHARVVINGEFVGVFVLVEQVDGRFARANFDDGKGNVYKEVWPLDQQGEPWPEQRYLDNLETNEDEDPSAAIMLAFAQALADAEPDQRKAVVEQYMNIDEALGYAVVDRMIRHDDGPFHWYCFNDSFCNPHNFYWYEDPTAETLHLIPWDLDNAFENLSRLANPVTPLGDGWGEITNDCEPYSLAGTFVPQVSAACDPLVATWVSYDDDYQQLLDEFLAGPGSEESIDEMLTMWHDQILDATTEAAGLHADATPITRWEAAIASLQADLATNHQ